MAHGHPAISDAARGGLKESSVRLGFIKRGALTVLAVALAGCANVSTRQLAPDEQPVVTGSAARRNHTPLEPAFTCVAQALRDKHFPQFGVAVGDVKDYTGKYSQNEGSTITQGGSLMIYSALGKLGDVIQLQERFDTRIAELELAYTDRRQLGDGRTHAVEQGKPAVPWVPYFGGSILRSNYYIVGGVTELNYNIASGGAELAVNNIGFKGRTFTMNIGVDLRIVDTRTLVIAKTVSLQKQIIGQEVGAGVYSFFGNDLVDINIGNKSQEPLQLGVRTTIEHGVIELIAAIAGVDGDRCLSNAVDIYRAGAAKTPFAQPAPQPVAQGPAAQPATPLPGVPAAGNGNGHAKGTSANGVPTATVMPAAIPEPAPVGLQPQNSLATAQGAAQTVMFEFGSSSISPEAMSVIDKMANDAAQGKPVTFQIIARDTETWPPMQRRELTNQRIKAVTDVLVRKQIQESRIGVTWMAAPTDSAITRAGAGYQLIATLVIGR
jgi:curli biogenesis system outer membrane secretion channel CsgG/outer membrane protein OmpA-like peptidoglycan-associated protein